MTFNEKYIKPLLAMVFASVMIFSLAACEEDGPAEEAGEKLDQMTSDAGNAIEDACENIKEGVNAEDTDC